MQAEIKGTTMPVLEVTLQQGEQVVSTHGELSWMTPSIQLSEAAQHGVTRDDYSGARTGRGQLPPGPEGIRVLVADAVAIAVADAVTQAFADAHADTEAEPLTAGALDR